MTLMDWLIVVVLVISVVDGLMKGFIRSVSSLGGLFLGLILASWNYGHVAAMLMPVARIEPVADTIAFILVAVLVMVACGWLGKLISSVVHEVGLGFVDSLAGGLFGFFKGALLVTLLILATLAFFPRAHWLEEGRLPHKFFGFCHLSIHMTPSELADKVREGLKNLEKESPGWLHPGINDSSSGHAAV